MKMKAIFFLFVLVFSLGTSRGMQIKTNSAKHCCTGEDFKKECSREAQSNENDCSKDYCNLFQNCNNSPIAVTQQIRSSQFFLTFKNSYPQIASHATTDFNSEPWHPPQVL